MFIARQWIRHRTANVNEYSGRYSLMPMLFYTPDAEQLQTQSRSNNQGRSGVPADPAQYREAVDRWNRIRSEATSAYEWMTQNEIARELARIDLPLSTYTQWYWKIDLHNLLHFLTLRADPHAQWEIQEFGRVMAGMLKRVAPLSYEAWLDYAVGGATLSRAEIELLAKLVRPDGEGLVAAGSVGPEDFVTAGLAPREARELLVKLTPRRLPDFELDLARGKPPEHFSERFAKAVPKVDAAPKE
jgi:thymidylate synthase (FAD)